MAMDFPASPGIGDIYSPPGRVNILPLGRSDWRS